MKLIRISCCIAVLALFQHPAHGQLNASDMAANLQEAFSFDKYPTYPQYDSMMQYWAENYPGLCRLDTFGTSREGRLLLALKISKNVHVSEPEPRFLYTATMHGDELIGYNLTTRLIDFLLTEYGGNTEVTRLLDNLEIWINPLSNPDATYYLGDHSVAGSVRSIGTDLNRNFPETAYGEPDDTTGRQKENQHMMLFLRKHMFNLSANLHSGAEVVNYPWDHTHDLHPDTDWYIFVSQEYADEARAVNPLYMDEFVDNEISGVTGIVNGADWYVIFGGRQDYVIVYLHGRELTLELSNPKKVLSEDLEEYWTYNKWSLFNYMSQATYGIHGTVTCSESGTPLGAEIRVQDHDNQSTWIVSDSLHGRFYRYISEGTYNLAVSAPGFLTKVVEDVAVVNYETTEIQVQLDSLETGLEWYISRPLALYPNPASGKIIISPANTVPGVPEALHGDPASLTGIFRIVSADGRTVVPSSINTSGTQLEIDISNLPEGVYFIGVKRGANIDWMKFIKKLP